MSNVFITNQVAFSGAGSMYELKKLLAGAGTDTSQGSAGGVGTAGWTVVRSSDGTTANTALSGVDRWQSASSGAKGCGNDNAWIVLQAPTDNGVTRQVCIQRGTADDSWRAGYSYGGLFTGGTATVAPTATDGKSMIGAPSVAGGSATDGFTSGTVTYSTAFFPTAGTFVMNAMARTTAPFAFWMTAYDGVNSMAALMLDGLISGSYPVSPDASPENDPYVTFGIPYTGGGIAQGVMGGGGGGTSAASFMKSWFKKGLAGVGWVQTDAGVFILGNAALSPSASLGGMTSNAKDVLLPVFYGRPAADTAPNGGKGFSTLLKQCARNRAIKDTVSISTATSKEYIVVGDYVLDWDGSVPALWRTSLGSRAYTMHPFSARARSSARACSSARRSSGCADGIRARRSTEAGRSWAVPTTQQRRTRDQVRAP